MLFLPIVSLVCGISTYPDHPPGTLESPGVANMAIFMALFMLCTVEVVIIKIIVFDQQMEDFRHTNRRMPASLWFDEDQI